MFGGFGSAAPAFGATHQTQQQPGAAGGGLFGAPAAGAAPAFGGQQPFGAQPQATTFGQTQPQPTGFGMNTGFGAAVRPAAFGGGQTTAAAPGQTGGLFGQPQQPATTAFGFGAQTAAAPTGGLFGQSAAAPAFGASAQQATFGFGAAAQPAQAAPAFGAPGVTTPTNNCGTGNPAYVVTQDRESTGTSSLSSVGLSNFLSITAMPNYKNWSFEELRVQDYLMGKKFSTTGGPGMTTGFGTTTGQTGMFGGGAFGASAAAPTGGLFGQTQTQPQATGFGFGTQQQTTATGIFGAPAAAPTTGLFGNTNTTGFGTGQQTTGAFGQQSAPQTTFGFGAASQPKTGFGAFGSTTTTTPAFGAQPLGGTGGAFGTTPATTNTFGTGSGAFGANTGGGLFGAPKPATTSPFGAPATTGFGGALASNPSTTGGMFGSAGTTTAFGTNTTSPFGGQPSTGIFGAAQPAAQTSLFGGAAASGGGIFGSAAPAATTGTFGATTNGAFGATKPAQGLFGSQPAGSTGFGFGATSAAPATGGLFGNAFQNTTAPTSTGFSLGTGFPSSTLGTGTGFGSSTAPTTGTLFGSTTGQSSLSQPAQGPQPSLLASIDKNPYGNNPLFQKSTTTSVANSGPLNANTAGPELFAPPSSTSEKKPGAIPHYKMTPKSASKIKLRGFTPSHAPSDFFGGLSSTTNGAASTPVPKSVLGMLKDDGAGDSIGTVTSGIGGSGYPGSFKPRVKKLIIPDDAENGGPNDDIFTENANSTPARKTESGKAESTRSVRFLDESSSVKIPTVDVTQSARNTGGLVDADPEPSGSGASSLSSTPMRALSMSGKKVSPYQASQEVAYETEPSLDQLLEMSDVELTHVEGYTVRLPGVGQVKFLKPVNLLEASPNNARSGISKIPGTVVILKHKVIEVYPDGTRKDPVGVGVNVPAVVKLEKCWVVDKSTGLVIDDESDPRFDRHMKRLANMEGTELLGFNTTTGTWRFKVEHFSRYGFDDDEDEEEGVPAESAEKAVPETSLEDKVADDSIAEESDEDDEDASFIGNDSFAHLKSWKPPVGKKVHDLRRVAALNSRAKSLELARQQQLLEKQRGLEEEIEDETFENDDSSDEAADRSLVSVGGNSAGAVERKSAITSPEHSNEEPMIISGFGSLNTDRKLSNMRSVLFQDRESSSQQQHAALNSSKFFSPKRGIESMMDYENSNTKEGSAKLNTISIGEEFLLEQSPAKFKRVTSLPPVSTSESTFKPKEKSPEHVVPVIQKSSMAVVPMKSLPNSYEFDFYDNGDTELSLPPLKESASYGHESSCVDAGLFMGRSSRVGWGPGGQFVVTGRSGYFRVDIANVRIFSRGEDIGASSQAEQARHVELLKVILDKATVPITSSLQTQAGEADRVMITSTQTPRSLLQSAPQNEAICPLALLDKSCKFSSLLSAVSSSHVFSESEKSIWTLASALFDDAELPLEESSLGDRVSDQIKISIQKQAVSTWLRNFAGSWRHAANGSNADLIYSHLITRHIGDAVKAAIKGRDFRLSTLLSQIGGVGSKVSVVSESLSLPGVGATNAKSSGHGVCYRSSTLESARQDISHQVEVWISRPQKTPIGEDYLRIWRLISGDVALWDSSVISSVGNWKQLFGLFLWYARGGSLSIGEAVSEYDDLRRSMKFALSPLPRHLESCDKAVSVMDICYNLLKLHSSGDFSLGSALLPLSISSNVLDYRITWLLWVLLSRAKHLREFSGHGNLVNIRLNEEGRRNSDMIVDGESSGNNDTYSMLVSKTADECTMSLVYALEGLGLWKWALFVALFLSTNIGRECCVRTILAKWYPGEDSSGSVMTNIRQKTGAAESEDWQFVVSRLNIPALWIHEAKALRARYDGNILQECVSLIDAKLFNGAHQRIVFFLCPFEIINESYLPVQAILQQLLSSTSQIENWKYGGGFILEYVDFVMKSQNMSCTEQANLPELSNKGVALLKILAEIKGRAEWMTTGLGYCFDGRTIERSRKEWGVCWCCMSSKILKVVSEVENMCGLESQISGSLLAKLPLVEDVRGKYASDVIHRFL